MIFDLKRIGHLTQQMTIRAIQERYRGSILGASWSFLTPLMMLLVYTFIFSTVFQSRWPGTASGDSKLKFAILLFSGLSLYGFMSEVLLQSSGIIINHTNYVKKVVFPVVILPIVVTMSALFNLGISLIILVFFQALSEHIVPLTTLFLPLIILPLALCLLGLSWFIASLGTYLRDINQIITPMVTALLFLGPILYPMSVLPSIAQKYMYLNPLSFPVEQVRDVVIWGKAPNWSGLAIYSAVSVLIFIAGKVWFTKTQKGFADVL